MSLYDKVLASASKQTTPEPVRPRDSAAVVPWRRSSLAGEIEVYWVRRTESLRFMGGWYSFPGGGLSRRDEATFASGAAGHAGDHESSDEEIRRLAACAIRELFEEIGILPSKEPLNGLRTPLSSPLSSMVSELREKLLGKRISLGDVAKRRGAALDPSRLTFAGRWTQPA